MATRKWHMSQALHSYTSLKTVVNELTEEEVLTALDVESRAQRRRSIVGRLISRAVRLNEMSYATSLKKRYADFSHRYQPIPTRSSEQANQGENHGKSKSNQDRS